MNISCCAGRFIYCFVPSWEEEEDLVVAACNYC